MERLTFTVGFMIHSKVSSIWSGLWEMDDGWRGILVIWFLDFKTSTLSHGGIQIGTGKGDGHGTKGIVDSSYENGGVSKFAKVGETRTLSGSDSPCEEIWIKLSNFLLRKY